VANVFDTQREYEPALTRLPPPVKVFRLACGLTQHQLAERASVSIGTVRNLENRRHRPTRETAKKVAAALGADLLEVFPEWKGYA
jgi:transcriptional regulator with XRE-family HTH domain